VNNNSNGGGIYAQATNDAIYAYASRATLDGAALVIDGRHVILGGNDGQ
jgi:hypothetical protein